MPLQTTVIGAWPKPDYLNISDWFSGKGSFKGEDLKALHGVGLRFDPRNAGKFVLNEELNNNVKKAAKEIIDEQINIGIDVITDGEVERGSYYVHVMRNIQGIDLNNLEKKDMRNGAYSNFIPAVRSKLQLQETGPSCWKEWQRSAEIAGDRAVVKFTIPGPMTLTDGLLNLYYEDENQMQKDLISCINQEILGLVKAGCKHIHIDEPVMMRYPEKALSYGLDNLAKCLVGVPDTVTKTVHLCCGYPNKLDNDNFPKAPKTNYNLLAPKIDTLGFDEVSIENAEANNDLSLLSLFKKTKVILGCVTVARSKIETEEEIKNKVTEALKFISPDRLILAPDCGLGMLPSNLIKQKLTNMKKVADEF